MKKMLAIMLLIIGITFLPSSIDMMSQEEDVPEPHAVPTSQTDAV